MKYILSAVFAIAAIYGMSARAERYSLNVGEFSTLKVSDDVSVDYRCVADSAGMAVFNGDETTASLIGFTNKKGQLNVGLTDKESAKGIKLPTVTVYSTFLVEVQNNSDSTVRVFNLPACNTFTATQVNNGRIVVRDLKATTVDANLNTGNGQVVLYGECDEANLTLIGTGMIQADGLEAQSVKCRAGGTGAIGCHPVKSLTIFGIGTTTVYYRGNPEIQKRAVGVKLEKID